MQKFNFARVRPGDPISARGFNELGAAASAALSNGAPLPKLANISSGLVAIKNVSGSDRERFDCMSLGATVFTIGDAAQEDLIFEVDDADPDETPVILQEPIADGLLGVGRIFGISLAKLEQASSASDLWGTPNGTNHNLDTGSSGPIKILAAPSTSADSLRPVLLGAAAQAGDNLYLYTLTAAISAGSGTATIRNMADDTEIESGATVDDPLGHMDGLPIGRRGVCVKVGGTYHAITPYVVDLRFTTPDFEATRDGTNWDGWHTGSECT